MTYFVPCVAGLKVWTSAAQKTKLVSRVVTPSDEALAILLLMNSETRWEEMYQDELKSKSKASPGADGKDGSTGHQIIGVDEIAAVKVTENDGDDSGREDEDDVEVVHRDKNGEGDKNAVDQVTKEKKKKWKSTLYTMDCSGMKNKEYGGWNNDGRRMFNRLVSDIKEDRQNHPEWEKRYLLKCASFSDGKGKRSAKIVVDEEEEWVEAENDLCFSDSEPEDEAVGGEDGLSIMGIPNWTHGSSGDEGESEDLDNSSIHAV